MPEADPVKNAPPAVKAATSRAASARTLVVTSLSDNLSRIKQPEIIGKS
jgi:hypothetical protein